MTAASTSPYLLDEPPTSTGKALLARAFWHWCAVQHGHSPEEIAAALEPEAAGERQDVFEVRLAARLIGELIAAGEVRTFARPFGGGTPEPLAASVWELDDFRRRFAMSALDPKAPFAPDAVPTHWIFVDLEDFNRLVERSFADFAPTPRAAAGAGNGPGHETGEVAALRVEDRHVRMPEIERRTGMSRSTIYRRIEKGRFPDRIPMDGNIASWWESDVAEWLANPR